MDSPFLPCVGNKLIEDLDSVVRDFDDENKALCPDLQCEGEERTARHFTLSKSNYGHDF